MILTPPKFAPKMKLGILRSAGPRVAFAYFAVSLLFIVPILPPSLIAQHYEAISWVTSCVLACLYFYLGLQILISYGRLRSPFGSRISRELSPKVLVGALSEATVETILTVIAIVVSWGVGVGGILASTHAWYIPGCLTGIQRDGVVRCASQGEFAEALINSLRALFGISSTISLMWAVFGCSIAMVDPHRVAE